MTSPVPGSSEMPQFPKLSGGLARTKRKSNKVGPNPPKLKRKLQPIMDMSPNPIRNKPGIPNGSTVGKVYKTY